MKAWFAALFHWKCPSFRWLDNGRFISIVPNKFSIPSLTALDCLDWPGQHNFYLFWFYKNTISWNYLPMLHFFQLGKIIHCRTSNTVLKSVTHMVMPIPTICRTIGVAYGGWQSMADSQIPTYQTLGGTAIADYGRKFRKRGWYLPLRQTKKPPLISAIAPPWPIFDNTEKTKINLHRNRLKAAFIVAWNKAGALFNPKGIVKYSKWARLVQWAILCPSSLSLIWWYPGVNLF